MFEDSTADELIEDFKERPDRLLWYSDIRKVLADTGETIVKLIDRLSYVEGAIDQYEERERAQLNRNRELETRIHQLAEEKRLLEQREINLMRRLL
jgi:hypothetical protein